MAIEVSSQVSAASLLTGAVVAFWRAKTLTPQQLIMVRLRGLTRIASERG
jgi:hypothetical protein